MNARVLYLFEAIVIAACSACGVGGNHGNGTDGNIASEPAVTAQNEPGYAIPHLIADRNYNSEKNDSTASAAVVAQNDSVTVAYYPIADSCAGPFRIGASVPGEVEGFVLTASYEDREGATTKIPVYTYEIGNEGWVRVTPQYDSTGCATDKIGEIFVYSDLFLTDRGVGAMSSVEQFAAAYPDLDIRYADEDGMFIVESPRLRNVQFLLESEYYIGAERNSAPNVSDFKEESYFTAIRIVR